MRARHSLDEPALHAFDVRGVLDSQVAPSEGERRELPWRPEKQVIRRACHHFGFRRRSVDLVLPAVHDRSFRVSLVLPDLSGHKLWGEAVGRKSFVLWEPSHYAPFA